jgi:hypothetical protein
MGGGGDGGFGARQDAEEARRAEARRQLNTLFGAYTPTTIDRASFTLPGSTSGMVYDEVSGGMRQVGGLPGTFDEAGYQAAVDAEAARAAESERNRAGLESLFASTRTNAFDAGKRRLDESRDQAARDLRFELFARGLHGGSVDIDQNALLGRTYSQGITDLGGKADAVATQLRGDNEASRLQLLGAIDSGMDAGSALSSALGQMRTSADRAASEAIGTNVGDLFSSAGLIYNQNRVAQGRQNANNWWQQNVPSRSGRSSSGARSGVVTFSG